MSAVADLKKRITDLHTPVQHMGQTWCGECSVQRSTGPRTEEWVAFAPHPCPTLEVLTSSDDKPTLPADMFDQWQRISVDTTEGGDVWQIRRLADRAASAWVLGTDGPFHTAQPLVDVVSGAVNEALTHLLELGLIDIDADRLHAAKGYPMSRKD